MESHEAERADIRDHLDPHGLAVRTRADGSIVAASSEGDVWMVGVYASEDTYEDGGYDTLADFTDPHEAADAYLAEPRA